MSEGTKLGEYKDSGEFNAARSNENSAALDEQELSATKIGDVSEFEQSLIEENVLPKEEMAEISEDQSLFEAHLDETVADYEEGDVIKGTVRSIEKSGILVDIKYKSDGFISNNEFSFDSSEIPSDFLSPGDEVFVYILKLETKEGYTMLSRKKAEHFMAWNQLAEIAKQRDVVSVQVRSKVEGGLVADYKGIKGFIPASHIVTGTVDELDNYLGKALEVVVLQADRRRRKVIFSHKLVRQRVQKEEAAKLLDDLEVGNTRKGRVSSIKDFGAFVDIGGVEGLVHISELSWSRVGHPSDVVEVGQEVDVFVIGVDREANRISLGMKQLQPDPWVKVSDKYEVGQKVTGKIVRVTSFGAFLQIEPELEGLIHISELSKNHVKSVEEVVKAGEEVEAVVIKVMPDEQKIGLSIRALESGEEPKAEKPVEVKTIEKREYKAPKTEMAHAFGIANEQLNDLKSKVEEKTDVKEETSVSEESSEANVSAEGSVESNETVNV